MTTPRRWSYSLRTLLVVVTVFGGLLGWLGWQSQIVHERKRLIDKGHRQYDVMFVTLARMHADLAIARTTGTSDWYSAPHEHMAEVSWVRRLMGDETIARIDVLGDFSTAQKAELSKLFPEAFIDWNATLSEKTPAPQP